MINKILVAIDNSSRSEKIFDTAVSLAQTTEATLMLLHILSEQDLDYPILPTYAYYAALKGSDGGMLYQKFDEYERQEAELLRNLVRKAIAQGVNAEYTQLNGNPGWEICELADNWSADLIIVGSRGLQGLKEMFLGSVSNYVTHHAPCSVLIVRQPIDSKSELLLDEKADTPEPLTT
ncbi:MAG: universal stress protein [Cyanobacteria bacterium P01_C01_bin.72]